MSFLLTFIGLGMVLALNTDQHGGASDTHSFSRPDEVAVKHLALDITVDFTSKRLRGKASLTIVNRTAARELYLDTRDMDIEQVTLDAEETITTFRMGKPVEHMGQPLVVDITAETQVVHVYYSTRPEAAALQWLEPAQTAGKQKPFLFTQSQAILARTWVPCQDHLGVRMTYAARVTVPKGMLSVMSAENPTANSPDGVYIHTMPQPIPSYLLALAVGDIEFRPIGKRSGVYAETPVVEKAAWEFAETEKMIEAAEKLYGPYRWGRYDIIVLPPSFPFGGMENPRLTFATPTVLTGDRSLTALVAHELAHSWSGNLVTMATWNDFWLNEGFTTYFERRIMEALYGREYSEMQALLGYQDLIREIHELGAESPDTRLLLSLEGRNPDDAVTDVPYEKGYFFLRLLEESVGRERWDAFLRTYFETCAFQTMTTSRFLEYLDEHLLRGDRALKETLQIDLWINSPGLPGNCPVVRSDALTKVEAQIAAWRTGTAASDLATQGWTTQEWLHFVRNLPEKMTTHEMAGLDRAFNFTGSGNSEILSAWFMLSIKHSYAAAYPALEQFLLEVGRRKFLKPLYTELAKTPEGTEMAKRIYAQARAGYHAVSVRTIDEILGWTR